MAEQSPFRQTEGISPMGVEDLEEVCRIERACFSSPWPRQAFEHSLADLGASCLVAWDAEGVVGYVICWFYGDRMLIANLAVRPEKQRRGWGSRLLKAALQAAQADHVKVVCLDVRESNEEAIRLYRRFGFRVVGRRPGYYTRPVEDALVMMREMS